MHDGGCYGALAIIIPSMRKLLNVYLQLTCLGRAKIAVVVESFDFKGRQLSAVHVYFIKCVYISYRASVLSKRRVTVPVF